MSSIICLSLETIPELQEHKKLFVVLEKSLAVMFILEYFLRIYVDNERLKFIFSFYGLVDLVSILPSIATFGILDLRFLRAFRFLRAIRIFKLARYSVAMDRLKSAVLEVKNEMIVFFVLTLIVLYIAAAGIYFFENAAQPEQFKSIFHSLWWAVATLTTVGYGDVYPVTVGGRIFTFLILIAGIGVFSVPSALLASAFSKKIND